MSDTIYQVAVHELRTRLGEAAARHQEELQVLAYHMGRIVLLRAIGEEVTLQEALVHSIVLDLQSSGIGAASTAVAETFDEIGGWLGRIATAGIKRALGL